MTKKHKVVSAILFGVAAFLMGASAALSAEKTTVTITADSKNDAGFVVNPDVEDSAKDLRKRIKKMKNVELVEENATVELRVTFRGWKEVGSVTAQYLPGYGTTVSRDKNRFVIVDVYVNGDKAVTLVNNPGVMSWGQAANHIRDRFKEFHEMNAENF